MTAATTTTPQSPVDRAKRLLREAIKQRSSVLTTWATLDTWCVVLSLRAGNFGIRAALSEALGAAQEKGFVESYPACEGREKTWRFAPRVNKARPAPSLLAGVMASPEAAAAALNTRRRYHRRHLSKL